MENELSRALARSDILPVDDYVKIRLDKRKALLARKRNRQLYVGPHVTVTFECWDSMWYQVQEMLYIEKGGDAQLADELAAYGPMVPNGSELVATLMFEIEDPARRARVLAGLGGVEETVSLSFGQCKIMAVSEQDVDRTTAEGKTSAVHFLHFPFDAEQKAAFKQPGSQIVFAIGHANYQHMAVLPEGVRLELSGDLD
jgi:hypothetical protein